MKATPLELPGVYLIEPEVYQDSRGFFLESFQRARYAEAGIGMEFVQDNQSRSTRGVLRGLHAQRRNPQGKLVRVARGEVFDVVVDIHKESPTYGRWVGVILDDISARQLWIPPGYAHGFQVLSEVADFEYKCTAYYMPDDEIGVVWSDPEIAIQWPLASPIVSDKDARLPLLEELTL